LQIGSKPDFAAARFILKQRTRVSGIVTFRPSLNPVIVPQHAFPSLGTPFGCLRCLGLQLWTNLQLWIWFRLHSCIDNQHRLVSCQRSSQSCHQPDSKCFPGQARKLYLGQCCSEERMVSVELPHTNPFADEPRSTLSNSQRKAYTDAVLCLQSKPPLTNQTIVPGAKSRYGELACPLKKCHADRNSR